MKINNKSNTNDKKPTKKKEKILNVLTCLLRVGFSYLLYMAMFIFL